jgi:hypothetical protein
MKLPMYGTANAIPVTTKPQIQAVRESKNYNTIL